MAWAVVQNTGTFNATAGTTLAVAFGSNVTAGNRIIVLGLALGGSATTATLSATDTRSTPYTAIATTLATHATALFRAKSSTASSRHPGPAPSRSQRACPPTSG
jgi:hypothetical protein